MLFFYLKNNVIASSLYSEIIIEFDGLSRDGDVINITGREFDLAGKNRGFEGDKGSYIKEKEKKKIEIILHLLPPLLPPLARSFSLPSLPDVVIDVPYSLPSAGSYSCIAYYPAVP